MATPRNSVERHFRVADSDHDRLFLRRFSLKLVPFGLEPFAGNAAIGAASVTRSSPLQGVMSLRQRRIVGLSGVKRGMLIFC